MSLTKVIQTSDQPPRDLDPDQADRTPPPLAKMPARKPSKSRRRACVLGIAAHQSHFRPI